MTKSNAVLFVLRAATILCALIALRIAGQSMPSSEYAVWIVARQLLGFLANVTVGAMVATALPRAVITFSTEKSERQCAPNAVLGSALWIALPPVLTLALLIGCSETAATRLAEVIFDSGSAQTLNLVRLLFLLLVPWTVLLLCSFYLRGRSRFSSGLLLEFGFGGLIPLSLFLAMQKPIAAEAVLLYYTVLLAFIAVLTLGALLAAGGGVKNALVPRRAICREIIAFGTPKLFSNLFPMCTFGLLSIYLLAAGIDLVSASAVVLVAGIVYPLCSIAILQITSSGFNALVALRDKPSELAAVVKELLRLAVFSCIAAALIGYTQMDLLVSIVSADAYGGFTSTVRFAGACLLLYLPILLLEVPLDALRPPWAKAKIGCLLAAAQLILLLVLPRFLPLSVFEVLTVIGALQLAYVAYLLWSLKQLAGITELVSTADCLRLAVFAAAVAAISWLADVSGAGFGARITAAIVVLGIAAAVLAQAKMLRLLLTGVESSASAADQAALPTL